jgi:hypothetical protein
MMKKTLYSLAFLLSMTAGLLLTTGCDNPDNQVDNPSGTLPAGSETDVIKTETPLAHAAISLNQDMARLDFSELAPLAETIPTVTRQAEDNTAVEFEDKLSGLLNLLRGDTEPTRSVSSVTLGRRFSFQAFNDALQVAWDITVILGEQGESSSSWFGLNTTKKGEVAYTAKNGDQYVVKGTIEKNVTLQFRGFKTKVVVTKVSDLSIDKNGQQVVKILSSSEDNRPVWLPVLIKNQFYTGQLFYDDYEINLSYDKNSSHQRTVDLTYSKAGSEGSLLTMSVKLEDDADILKLIRHDVEVKADFIVTSQNGLLVFTGSVKNVNYLVVNGIKIANAMKYGCSEEECQQLITDFNNNLTLSITLENLQLGNLYMGSQYDEVSGYYYPTIMIHSPMLGEQDYSLTTLLSILGVDIPDILKNVAEIEQAK